MLPISFQKSATAKQPALPQGWLTACHQAQYLTVLTSVTAMDNIVVSTE
jgi:hypothetical protein